MAVITTLTSLGGGKVIGGALDRLFGGGESGADARKRKRQKLSQLGFNWRDVKGTDPRLSWNINNWLDPALDNLARLHSEFPEIAIELHNNRKLNNQIASSYSTLRQIALAEQEERAPKTNFGGIGFTQSGGGMSDGVKALLTAGAIAGGLFFFLND